MKISTYLHFNGNCEQALNFYVKALGAKIVMMLRYGDAPLAEPTCTDSKQKIMHGRLLLGEDFIMASDCPPDHFREQAGFSVNISVVKPEEGERLFAALAEGAKEIGMPYAETFWAHGFGMLVDQFGIPWMVNCEKKG